MKKPKLVSMFAGALVLNTFLMRPAALGQQYVSVAMVLGLILVVLYFFMAEKRSGIIENRVGLDFGFVIALVLLYWAYEFPLGILRGSDEILLAKEFVSTIVIVGCYSAFLVRRDENREFFRIFSTVVGLLGWSGMVTMTLSLITGLNALYLFPIQIQGYESSPAVVDGMQTGAVYFPFSMLYSLYTTGDIQLNRFSNFFREAGIYQAISIFLFAYERFTRRSRFVTIGLMAGALLSLSTLGLLLLPLTGGLVYIARRRANMIRFSIAIAVGVAAIGVLLFAPAIGLSDKMDQHSASVTERSEAISRGIDSIMTDGFGTGVYSGTRAGNAICLIASISSIGIIGFLIQSILISGARPGDRIFGKKVITCFPLFVTALISQPIAGAGMTYILAMVVVPSIVEQRQRKEFERLALSKHMQRGTSVFDHVVKN
ncbi:MULTISPECIES: hypothetical protein [Burkholderia]|uniref:O-antigen ligase like membrane protein n=3 Tax=Burkholderia vietnamiensis TaxID=60552 RepID=A4JT10_BURVG|nr:MULTISPECIES: hypothetical protein [Burkholderia]ABO59413.1 hypothetical protein Bcep1808_6516 [Burkholderia vietnamiensis G4]MBR8216447.1 hypothetical protein [Burkholderia vietnamiensis]MCA8449728.1 hypothetical protein [Burkholderia vietnamiensis]MCB4348175.1 hypothetical protein [Burkholderia vietnamiensis]MDN8076495.1 hypothetical protein [Burkholderia vietnamiensis]